MWAGNWAPAGWLPCDGRLLAISENDALFTLIGTTYGGDGQETFAIPNIAARFPVHQATGFTLGELSGTESVTLTTQQIPVHNHAFLATLLAGDEGTAGGNLVAQGTNTQLYRESTPTVAMAPQMVAPVGGSQPHENMPPYLVITFIISLFGEFPQQN